MKIEHFLLLAGGLGVISISCGCGLYQHFAHERNRKRKNRVYTMLRAYVPTLRYLYEDNEYLFEEVWYEKAR